MNQNKISGSNDFKRLNPHLFGDLGGVRSEVAKPTATLALDSRQPRIQKGQGRVAFRIVLMSLRRRLLDPDNLAGSTKHLQDAVCETIGIDDGDPRVEFEYRQVRTDGKQGVIVKIDFL